MLAVVMENWETFFEFLENDTFVRQWYRNVEGNKVWGLHAPEAVALPREVTSLGDAATNLMKDARIREIFSGKGYYECDDIDSMPSASDPGDTWHHGPPIRPRWAGGLELCTGRSL